MTEDEIRDSVMQALYDRIGKPGSWHGQGKSASFSLGRDELAATCNAERALPYMLPNGDRLTHKSDILIEFSNIQTSTRSYISIEIKHRSAVTDQFKCRSYDMHHLKRAFGSSLSGIMLFARAGQGISLERARAIAYPFDEFIGIDMLAAKTPAPWGDLLDRVESILDAGKP